DLKPENVMLGPFGETLVLDWGIAKVKGHPEVAPSGDDSTGDGMTYVQLLESSEDTATQAGAILGSPSYMSPETAAGRNDEVDEQSDIFLLGACLYEI